MLSEIKKIQVSAREHFQRILNDHEKLKSQLETHKNDLELRGVELEKREALNETERKKLAEELEQVLCLILDLSPFACSPLKIYVELSFATTVVS